MATFQRWALPMPLFVAPGQTVPLDDIIETMFGAIPANWPNVWLYYFGEAYMAPLNFGYWPGDPDKAHSWLFNGVDVGEHSFSAGKGSPLVGTQQVVQRANLGAAALETGNAIGALAQLVAPIQAQGGPVTNSAVYSLLVVDPALKSATAGVRAPTAAEIVASANRFNDYYGNVRNPDDCTWIAMAVVGAAGATLGTNVQSLDPSQNEESGFWRIAYRGDDPGQAADWTRLAQPGDLVRMGWNPGDGFHMFTVIEQLGPGSLRIYDNNRPDPGGITIGFHNYTNLQTTTRPETITIYRLTTDNLYLIPGSAESDRPPGTQFNDKMVGAGGADHLFGWIGNDLLIGGAGSDILEGGDGEDTAQFAGWTADFTLTQTSGGWTVADKRSGAPEGTDTLSGVELLKFSDQTMILGPVSHETRAAVAVANILRLDPNGAAGKALADSLAADLRAGLSISQVVDKVVDAADGSTAVAAMTYQFFLGFAPSGGGFDYLVSPTGPNPNNINSAYYQFFSTENRYINFAVNVGSAGDGKAAFTAEYGSLTLRQATAKAYQEIFGGTAPNDAFLNLLLDAAVEGGMTRKDYFAYYGRDGLEGLGTKAAMVGWLLTEAAKADVGTMVRSNNAYLTDLADGAPFLVDMVGVYAQPDWAHNPPG